MVLTWRQWRDGGGSDEVGVEMMDGGDDMVLMMMVRWRGDGGEGSVSGAVGVAG
ncbi:hypothetical protein Tco_0343041, partial [Tanacetum coccineum]